MDVNDTMIQNIPTPAKLPTGAPRLECFSCGEPVTIEELLLVDQLIENSHCFIAISENFTNCSGDDSLFHDNVVNCDAACYAAIVQTVAPHDEQMRRAEIANIAAALRARPQVPVSAIITLERLMASLVAVGPAPRVSSADICEALYCRTSPIYTLLG